jgi:hypothetical protein
MSAFAGGAGPFGSMSVADLGSLTRLEVELYLINLKGKSHIFDMIFFVVKKAYTKIT